MTANPNLCGSLVPCYEIDAEIAKQFLEDQSVLI